MSRLRPVTNLAAQPGAGVVEVSMASESARIKGAMLLFAVLAWAVVPAAAALDDADADTPAAPPSVAAVQAPAAGLSAETASRGQLLYENHCLDCHESVVFIRERRTVVDPTGLRTTVLRWAAELKLPWGRDELDDVARYLNGAYYHFVLP